ncbi:MAG: hypothetical protein D6722_10830 [Bacteroidetes bacterium]|nr:MAG: hypothetical protein D6722_10830 [Bacteroidota bacterium]
MKYKKARLVALVAHLDALREQAFHYEAKYRTRLSKVHSSYQLSAINLIHYLALRREDIRVVQKALGNMGLSRLGRAESHVMASVLAIRKALAALAGKKANLPDAPAPARIDFKEGRRLLKRHTNSLLGKKIKGTHIRIMVTLPSEAAERYELVRDLVVGGMSAARINCAHDGPEVWKQMVRQVRRASRETGRNCRVCMDLGGPKLRTGPMEPGPEVIHLRPKRNPLGQVINPARALLWPDDQPAPVHAGGEPLLPMPAAWLAGLSLGDVLSLKDSRGKTCLLTVTALLEAGRVVETHDSTYIQAGAEVSLKHGTHPGGPGLVGSLPPVESFMVLHTGDTLILHADPRPGAPAVYDETGQLLAPAHISCTLPAVFADVKVGEPVLMNDGKIEGRIRVAQPDALEIEITFAKEGGAKLRADKGINFPESALGVRGLTDKDRQDLEFVVEHADVVNFSFVNSSQDVEDLLDALHTLHAEDLGIILKIETRKGYTHLPDILLTAMQNHPIGVMLARGDLAIEAGWEHLAHVQEEVLRICEAAHVPIVWATQVLESHAKKGLASRAEITDAAKAHNAECVMLNKGPHILRTLGLLNEILESMEEYRQKTAPMLPGLKVLIPSSGLLGRE